MNHEFISREALTINEFSCLLVPDLGMSTRPGLDLKLYLWVVFGFNRNTWFGWLVSFIVLSISRLAASLRLSSNSHILMQGLGKLKKENIDCIPNNTEKYISFSINNLVFIDSLQFLNSSLERLVDNLSKEGVDKFQLLSKYIVIRYLFC